MIGYVTVGSNDLDGNKLNVFYMDMSGVRRRTRERSFAWLDLLKPAPVSWQSQ
jgi:hypothetical protein